jgi:hypothetical protein
MFQVSALRRDDFEELFTLDDEALARRGAKRCIADRRPGYPCRVSLQDAEPGERLILVPFAHQPAHSPYRASGPIFVREAAQTAWLPPDTIPELLRTRLLSVRAYDADHLMTDADAIDGRTLDDVLNRMLDDQRVSYVHVHFARPGCYACRVDRVRD